MLSGKKKYYLAVAQVRLAPAFGPVTKEAYNKENILYNSKEIAAIETHVAIGCGEGQAKKAEES